MANDNTDDDKKIDTSDIPEQSSEFFAAAKLEEPSLRIGRSAATYPILPEPTQRRYALPPHMRATLSIFVMSPSTGLGIEIKMNDCPYLSTEASVFQKATAEACQILNKASRKNDARPMTAKEVDEFIKLNNKSEGNSNAAPPRNRLS